MADQRHHNLPPCHETVIIIGRDYRSLGYLDDEGVWRQQFDHRELREVTDWCFLK